MSLFAEKRKIRFSELEKALKRDPGFVPFSDKRFDEDEKQRILDDVFGIKQKDYVVKEREYRDRLRDLELKAHDASAWEEKENMETRLKYLKKFL